MIYGKRVAAAFAIIATLGIVACGPQSDGSARESIAVGVVLPLTGDAAVYGEAIRNGIELAKSELADQDGVRTIRLRYEDDQGVATTAVSATRRLIDVERVPVIIGGAMSSTAEATIPVCESAEVVLVSPTATKPSLTEMGEYFFRLWPSDDYDGKIMAEAAYNSLGLRRISILYVNLAYGVGITEVFAREFRRLGGEIVSRDGYSQGATDFRTLLTKIRAQAPDAIYLPGYVVEISQILKQAKELGLNAKFLGVNSLYDPKLIEIAGEAAEGAVFTYPTFDVTSSDPTIASFVAAYEAKYGSAPDAFAAQGYDAFRVIAKALESGETTGNEIRAALHSLGRIEGAGGSFEFDDRGDVEKPLRLITVTNGDFVTMPNVDR